MILEMLMKEGRFGRQSKASLKCIDLIGSPHRPHRQNTQTITKSEVSKLLRLLLLCPVVHFEWTIEVLIEFHLMEPFLGIMLDMQPRPIHLALRSVFQNLYNQIMEPILGLQFCSIKRCALPALSDGFFREYKEWMQSFAKRLEQYDSMKLESAV